MQNEPFFQSISPPSLFKSHAKIKKTKPRMFEKSKKDNKNKTNPTFSLNVKKGHWSREEDQKLREFMSQHTPPYTRSLWRKASEVFEGTRTEKQCRGHWVTVLDVTYDRSPVGEQEEILIIDLHGKYSMPFKNIVRRLPTRRSPEFVKNVWHVYVKREKARKRAQEEFEQLIINQIVHTSPYQMTIPEDEPLGEISFESFFDKFDLPILV